MEINANSFGYKMLQKDSSYEFTNSSNNIGREKSNIPQQYINDNFTFENSDFSHIKQFSPHKCDRLELSSDYKRERLVLSAETNEAIWKERFHFNMNLVGNKITDEKLAEHFAYYGNTLDEAYSEGKVTEAEYNELNSALDNYMESTTRSVENIRAFYEIMKDRSEMTPDERYSYFTDMNKIEPEDYQQMLKMQIQEYVDSIFKIDRNTLTTLVKSLRAARII